ncbi:MAG: heme NO-binding domain-containing protein [Alphaproteobacteria bacterium]|nr:heme NO-binding domain-containing protein [Alphaproteobacteria bacterium]
MYGMVNNAFRRYVIDREGEAAWNEIVAGAGLETAEFGAMVPYDDSVTLAIVGAMVSRSGRDVEDLLRDVGKSWVGFAKTTPFAGLLAIAGRDFETLLNNLDDMHTKIKPSLPTIRPPSFACRRRDDGLLEITYHSERESLFPFVEGIFQGVAEDFGEEIEFVDFKPQSPTSATWVLAISSAAGEAA